MSLPPEPEIQSAARLLAEGRPADAASRLAALVADAPTYAAAHVLRATALEAAGRVDDALVSWGRAAALVPRSALVHRERARLLATQITEDVAPSLPPPVPAPSVEAVQAPPVEAVQAPPVSPPAPAPEPARESIPEPGDGYDDDYADGPLLGFGEPAAFDPGDLVFDAPPTPDTPEPEASAPPEMAPPPAAPHAAPPHPAPPPAEWADETGLASVLPPEAPAPSDAPPPPSSQDFGMPSEGWSLVEESGVSVLPPSASPDHSTPTVGWSLVEESDVPAPPHAAQVSPDVIAPEGDLAPPPEPPAPAPEATVEDVPPPMPSVADELDSLIAQLEVAPRIKPDPAYSGPTIDPDAGTVDDLASETLAKIYAAQHQYVEAALMYEKLAAQKPESADDMLERAAELRRKGG